jgi:hypothetical protein
VYRDECFDFMHLIDVWVESSCYCECSDTFSSSKELRDFLAECVPELEG